MRNEVLFSASCEHRIEAARAQRCIRIPYSPDNVGQHDEPGAHQEIMLPSSFSKIRRMIAKPRFPSATPAHTRQRIRVPFHPGGSACHSPQGNRPR